MSRSEIKSRSRTSQSRMLQFHSQISLLACIRSFPHPVRGTTIPQSKLFQFRHPSLRHLPFLVLASPASAYAGICDSATGTSSKRCTSSRVRVSRANKARASFSVFALLASIISCAARSACSSRRLISVSASCFSRKRFGEKRFGVDGAERRP